MRSLKRIAVIRRGKFKFYTHAATQRRNENLFHYLGFWSLRCVVASLREPDFRFFSALSGFIRIHPMYPWLITVSRIIQTIAQSGNNSTGLVYLLFPCLAYGEIINTVVHNSVRR